MDKSSLQVNSDWASFLWIIKDFERWLIADFDDIKSHTFELKNKCKFSCQLRCCCSLSNVFILQPVLILEESCCKMPVSCFIKFCTLDQKLCAQNTNSFRYTFTFPQKCFAFRNFTIKLDGTVVKNADKLLFHGDLIQFCEIIFGEEPQVRNCSINSPANQFLASRRACLLQTGHFSDFMVNVKGRQFLCHRFVLGCRSEYFSALFKHNMVENRENKLVLSDIEPDTFKKVLQYIYTGEVNVLENDALPLLTAADRFRLEGLVALCEDKLHSSLCLGNTAELFKVGSLYNLQRLKMDAFRIEQCFGEDETLPASNSMASNMAKNRAKIVEKKANYFIQTWFSKRCEIMKTLCLGNVCPTFSDFWCHTKRLVLAKSLWYIKKFTRDYFSDPAAVKEHVVTAADSVWKVEISNFKMQYKELNFQLKITSDIEGGVPLRMAFKISILNVRSKKTRVVHGSMQLGSKREVESPHIVIVERDVLPEGSWEFTMLVTFVRDESVLYEGLLPNVQWSDLTDYLADCRLHDVVVRIQGEEFLSHKAILDNHFPFLVSMLRDNSAETVIEINEMEPRIFKKILTFIYTSRFEFTDEELKEFHPFAKKYNVMAILYNSKRSKRLIECCRSPN